MGHSLEVLPPSGRFFTQLDAAHAKFYVAMAAGSGITPIISILTTTLEIEQESKFVLLFGNRAVETIMFRDELQKLKDKHPERFQILHFLSRATDAAGHLEASLDRESVYADLAHELVEGRLDQSKVNRLLSTFLFPEEVHEWFLCGPQALVQETRETLIEHGVDATHIHRELFLAAPTGKPAAAARVAADAVMSAVTISAGGKSTAFDLAMETDTVLDAGMRLRTDLPYACLGGACGTCRARLLEGTVEMEQNFALEADEVESGYVLTCQSRPTSPKVSLDFDA